MIPHTEAELLLKLQHLEELARNAQTMHLVERGDYRDPLHPHAHILLGPYAIYMRDEPLPADWI